MRALRDSSAAHQGESFSQNAGGTDVQNFQRKLSPLSGRLLHVQWETDRTAPRSRTTEVAQYLPATVYRKFSPVSGAGLAGSTGQHYTARGCTWGSRGLRALQPTREIIPGALLRGALKRGDKKGVRKIKRRSKKGRV